MVNTSTIAVILILASTFLSAAQAPDTMWTRIYGGTGADVAYSVTETSDGHYLVAGYTGFGAGVQDCWLLKLDKDGDTLWTKTFGGAAEDGAHRVTEAADGGYIVVGYTESSGQGGKDIYIIKTDRNGSQKWVKTYGSGLQDVGYGIVKTSGGYVICGYRNGPSGWDKGDLWILKINESGDTLWTRTYGGAGQDYCLSIKQLDDGFIMSGSTSSFGTGGKDAWLVRTDSDGDTLWTRTYGGVMEDVAYGVNITKTGGFIMTGYVDGTGEWTAGDFWMAETDESGDTLWEKRYGSAGEDFGFDIHPTTDGGYVTGGERALNGGDLWIVKTDARGDTLWSGNHGGQGAQSSLSIFPASDGGFIAAGMTITASAPDLFIVKTRPVLELTSPNGGENLASGASYAIRWHVENSPKPPHTFRLLCSKDGDTSFKDTIAAGLNPQDSSYTWTVPSNQGSAFRIRIELLDASGMMISRDESADNFNIVAGVEERPMLQGLNLDVMSLQGGEGVLRVRYTLPLGEQGTISLYDPAGRRIENFRVQGEGKVSLGTNLSSGVYFVRLEMEHSTVVRKAFVLN